LWQACSGGGDLVGDPSAEAGLHFPFPRGSMPAGGALVHRKCANRRVLQAGQGPRTRAVGAPQQHESGREARSLTSARAFFDFGVGPQLRAGVAARRHCHWSALFAYEG